MGNKAAKSTPPAAIMMTCHGEAHTNAYIDNCHSCAPLWGTMATCAVCATKGQQGVRLAFYKGKRRLPAPACPLCATVHAPIPSLAQVKLAALRETES